MSSPRPGNSVVLFALLSGVSQALRAGWCGSLPRRRARSLAGVAGGQLVVKVGADDTAAIESKMIYKMAYTKTKRPEGRMFARYLAETQGFEPWIQVLPRCTLSRGVPSTTRPRLRYFKINELQTSLLIRTSIWPTGGQRRNNVKHSQQKQQMQTTEQEGRDCSGKVISEQTRY